MVWVMWLVLTVKACLGDLNGLGSIGGLGSLLRFLEVTIFEKCCSFIEQLLV